MSGKIFQVSEVNLYIKNLFREDFLLNHLKIEGEVSNATVHSSGHVYFTLKDETSAISCVLFAGYGGRLAVSPQNGKKIIITGGIGVYEKTGKYQVYVRDIEESGHGDLYRKLEELKKKLSEEGIFQKPKKEIPASPERIGIVTSSTGAALQDILQIAGRRNSSVTLILYPTLVQGDRAAVNIAAGIDYFNAQADKVDILIVGRGGGSMEDLWAFSEEPVVRAIYRSQIPVISAVGHEIDFSLADLVSDLRAPTPSAAAELAIPAKADQKRALAEYSARLNREFLSYINRISGELEILRLRLANMHPRRRLEELSVQLMERERELSREFSLYLKRFRWKIESMEKQIVLLSPTGKLGKGYSYLETADGISVEGIASVRVGEELTAFLADGKLKLKVEEKISGS